MSNDYNASEVDPKRLAHMNDGECLNVRFRLPAIVAIHVLVENQDYQDQKYGYVVLMNDGQQHAVIDVAKPHMFVEAMFGERETAGPYANPNFNNKDLAGKNGYGRWFTVLATDAVDTVECSEHDVFGGQAVVDVELMPGEHSMRLLVPAWNNDDAVSGLFGTEHSILRRNDGRSSSGRWGAGMWCEGE